MDQAAAAAAATNAATQMAAAITAANAAAITATALSAAVSTMHAQPASACGGSLPPVVEQQQKTRDPLLVQFEEYLLHSLRANDVEKDEEGVYVFNVNQVAYLVEESKTEEQKRASRRKVASALDQVLHTTKHSHRSNKGDTFLIILK
jgi:hypothetical protein